MTITGPLLEFFFVMSAIIQNLEAHIIANMYSESFSAEIDESAHPTSGLREETDLTMRIFTMIKTITLVVDVRPVKRATT
jgi:hypothetical protein